MILWVHGCSKQQSFLQPLAEGLIDHAKVGSKIFWISLPEEEIHVINVELFSDIWLNFALVTVQSCTVHMETYQDSSIVLLRNANL